MGSLSFRSVEDDRVSHGRMPKRKTVTTPDRLQQQLSSIRGSLDRIDSSLLSLLHERISLVEEIGRIKTRMARGSWAPAREKEVLERLVRENRGLFPDRALKHIFGEIFSVSRQKEKPIRVVYYGLPGSLTHAASVEQFGSSTRYEASDNVEEVFERVGAGLADYGFVPPEVSCEGIKSHSLELLLRSDLTISAEYYLNLELVLASSRRQAPIREVVVQPQVFGLVREWMGAHLPRDLTITWLTGSAEAAAACRGREGVACITLPFTARHFGLTVRAGPIPYGPTRRLRFFATGRSLPPATRSDKTTIAFTLVDRVGVLEETLKAFRKQKINLSFLETYPASRASPTDIFFADVLGHMDEPAIVKAVRELRRCCAFVKVLGSYPVFQSG